MSLYFEDFVLDSTTTSRGRTVTETDIVNFAGLSGDFVELHMNEEDYQSWVAFETDEPAYVLTHDGVPIVTVYGRRSR